MRAPALLVHVRAAGVVRVVVRDLPEGDLVDAHERSEVEEAIVRVLGDGDHRPVRVRLIPALHLDPVPVEVELRVVERPVGVIVQQRVAAELESLLWVVDLQEGEVREAAGGWVVDPELVGLRHGEAGGVVGDHLDDGVAGEVVDGAEHDAHGHRHDQEPVNVVDAAHESSRRLKTPS